MTGDCHYCSGKHTTTVCTFKGAECHNCGKKGHIARVCRSKVAKPSHLQESQREGEKFKCNQRQIQRKNTLHVSIESETTFSTKTDDRNTIYTLFNTMGGPDTEPLVTTVSVNEAKLMMEVDTRASASVVDETAYCNTQQSSSHRR